MDWDNNNIFILSGNDPDSKDMLIKSVRGCMISGAAIFKSLIGTT